MQRTDMGIIRLPLRFEDSKGERNVYALFDSGATFSCINEEYAHEIGNPEQLRTPLEVATAGEGHYIKVNEARRADFNCRYKTHRRGGWSGLSARLVSL